MAQGALRGEPGRSGREREAHQLSLRMGGAAETGLMGGDGQGSLPDGALLLSAGRGDFCAREISELGMGSRES